MNARGELIKYPEFNSNVGLGGGPARRYRLYQVAAVVHTKRRYPGMTGDELIQWARHLAESKLAWEDPMGAPEGSHLCRFDADMYVRNPDQSRYNLVGVVECKGCFNPKHCVLEAGIANRSRIACGAGELCQHEPKCIYVEDPHTGIVPAAGEPNVADAVQSILLAPPPSGPATALTQAHAG